MTPADALEGTSVFRPSRDELWALFEGSQVAILLCDRESVHYANAALLTLSGWDTPAQVLALHPVNDLVAPLDREAFRLQLERLLSGADTGDMRFTRVLRRDGSLLEVVARSQLFLCGGQAYAFVTLADATAMREEQARLALLVQAVDTIDEAIIVADPRLKVIYANRAAGDLMGRACEDLLGVDVRSFISPSIRQQELEMAQALEETGRISGEFLMRRPSGDEFPARLTISLVRDPEGAEVARIGIVRDVTEQKGLEAEQELRERQLAAMLREAHHRICNSLQLASDLLVLQSRGATPEVSRALSRAAERLRALGIVHQWISPDHDVLEVEVRYVVETVVRSLREALASSGETIRFDVSVAGCRLASREATALALITTELLTNAIRHGHPTAIGVRSSCEGGRCCLEITDNGTDGSPPAEGDESGGFGLQLVRLLTKEQLQGTFSLHRVGPATVARVHFAPARPAPA